MPTPFDPELCLRIAGERAILDPEPEDDPTWGSPFEEVVNALSAIGALSDDALDAIVDDYQLALSLRGKGDDPPISRRSRSAPSPVAVPPSPPLTAARVVACEQDLDQPWGRVHLHYVSLGDRGTSVAITAVESTPSPPVSMSQMPPGAGMPLMPPGFRQVPLSDDQGSTEMAHTTEMSHGSRNPGHWQGRLGTMAPLSRATRWIDFGSARVELGDEDNQPPPVHVESLQGGLAARYLRLRLATGQFSMPPTPDRVEASIQTLIAADALHDDDPIVAEARAVAAASSGQGVSGLPEPWASLWGRQRRGGGPIGTVPVGVVTPPVDGIAINIDVLVSTDNGFDLQVATSPEILPVGDMPRIAWWAEDDNGNHYLGGTASWGAGTGRSAGRIHYRPPIDAQATELRIIPTGLSERAVVTLKPLPWAARP